jgi:hypothetical protein
MQDLLLRRMDELCRSNNNNCYLAFEYIGYTFYTYIYMDCFKNDGLHMK